MRCLQERENLRDLLEAHIKRLAQNGEVLQILEAGCGREWYFGMDGVKFELTGVDLDAAALQARVSDKKDLTRSIVGDLLTVDLAPESYDVIYNAYVLEHIPTAEKALDNFVRWLKPGGVLILTMPDRDSAYGFMTRLTPHFVHVLYYRYAWKLKDAGKPGFAPYRTFYDKVVSRKGIREFAAKHGLRVREELGYGSFWRGNGIFPLLTTSIAKFLSIFSLGRIHSRYVDLAYVLEKPAETKEGRRPFAPPATPATHQVAMPAAGG